MEPQKNSIYLTLSQAAKETGKSKSVIANALKNGTISYVSKDETGYKIDPAELFRVFSKNGSENASEERFRTVENALENGFENALKMKELEVTLKAAEQEKTFFKEQFGKMEEDRNHWRDQAQRLALTFNPAFNPPEKPAETPIAPAPVLLPLAPETRSYSAIWPVLVALLIIALVIVSTWAFLLPHV